MKAIGLRLKCKTADKKSADKFKSNFFAFLIFLQLFFTHSIAGATDLESSINEIEKSWGQIYYSSQSDEDKHAGYKKLIAQTEQLAKEFPKKAEPLVWKGILIANIAGVLGFFEKATALAKVKDAKKALEDSLSLDKEALGGTAYINLGILYHEVPGNPVSFGDLKKSEEMFKKALLVSSDSIDANYNYAKLLEDQDHTEQAVIYYKKALKVKSRPAQKFVDENLKAEVLKQLKALDPSAAIEVTSLNTEYRQIIQGSSAASEATAAAQDKYKTASPLTVSTR